MLVQVDLQHDARYLTCWVENSPKLKVGRYITLKNHVENTLLWRVLRIGEPQEASKINHGWNNNI